MPAKSDSKQAKIQALREEGVLNPAPEKVEDPKFQQGEFFDPRDAVQVKYELLRRVLVDKASVTDAAQAYGISRPTYYQAKASFEKAGIAGLVPRKGVLMAHTRFRGKSWCFSSNNGSLVNRSVRATWRNWCEPNLALPSTRARSSAP